LRSNVEGDSTPTKQARILQWTVKTDLLIEIDDNSKSNNELIEELMCGKLSLENAKIVREEICNKKNINIHPIEYWFGGVEGVCND
jgi:hypothetical protein